MTEGFQEDMLWSVGAGVQVLALTLLGMGDRHVRREVPIPQSAVERSRKLWCAVQHVLWKGVPCSIVLWRVLMCQRPLPAQLVDQGV